MSHRVITAPGKLVIAGEYAVLEGYSGIATAINRRVRVTSSSSSKMQVSGMGLGPFDVEVKNHQILIKSDPGHYFDLFACIYKQALQQNIDVSDQHIHIDSSSLFQNIAGTEQKLGLGSSGAVAVGLATQLISQTDRALDRDNIFALALKGHQQFSGGRGSGIDVATSCYGGTIRFNMNGSDDTPQISSISSRLDAHSLTCVFGGQSQNTRDFLDAVAQFKASQPGNYQVVIKKLGEIASELEGILQRELDWPRLSSIVHDNLRILEELGHHSHIDLVTDLHRELSTLARRHGGAAKPSGAGGGDIAMCFVPPERKTAFLHDLVGLGLHSLHLELNAPSVKIE